MNGTKRTEPQQKSIMLAAGGTGGHLFPAIALGEELIERGYIVHLITDFRCKQYLTTDLKLISYVMDFKPDRGSVFTILKSVIKLIITIFYVFKIMRKARPSSIVGFGGYPSIPPMLVAILLRIPIIIHEQNCLLGKANLFLLRFAEVLAISYSEITNIDLVNKKKIVVTGDIIRREIRDIAVKDHFNNLTFRLLIIGGSQGARIFSTLIPEAIVILLQEHPNIKICITQQLSEGDQEKVENIYKTLGISYKLASFFHDIANQYSNSELVIARAGAMTIAELTSIGLPAIFIPYPHSTENHQLYNAKAIENCGGGWCFTQSSVTPTQIASKLAELIRNRNMLEYASSRLVSRKIDGYRILADTVERIISY